MKKRKFVKLMPRKGGLYVGSEKSCSCSTSLTNRLHNSKAVVTAAKLRVVVKWVTYSKIGIITG